MPSWIEFALVRDVLRGWRAAAWESRSSFLPATASSSVTVWRHCDAVLGRMSGEERWAASLKMPPSTELLVSCEVRGVGMKAPCSAKMPAIDTRHMPCEPGSRDNGAWQGAAHLPGRSWSCSRPSGRA
eukprot:scaffold65255_cov46-Phaeocystis_antarctica.AAC.4